MKRTALADKSVSLISRLFLKGLFWGRSRGYCIKCSGISRIMGGAQLGVLIGGSISIMCNLWSHMCKEIFVVWWGSSQSGALTIRKMIMLFCYKWVGHADRYVGRVLKPNWKVELKALTFGFSVELIGWYRVKPIFVKQAITHTWIFSLLKTLFFEFLSIVFLSVVHITIERASFL